MWLGSLSTIDSSNSSTISMNVSLHSLVALLLAFWAATSTAQTYTPPEPQGSDSRFVAIDASDDSELDTYAFNRVDINVVVDRYVGPVDANGYLVDADGLIDAGAVEPYVSLQIYAGVDRDLQKYDYVYLNDPSLATPVGIMSKAAWQTQSQVRLFTFMVDVRKVKFPRLDGSGSVVPAVNTVSVDIDAFYNTSNPNRLGTYVDWVSIGFTGTRPVLLVHGWNGSPEWATWRAGLSSRGVPYTATSPGLNRLPRVGARAVRDSILALQIRYGVDRVNVVAHSQGGLDVRQYMWYDRGKTIDTFLMLGTPNGGAPVAEEYPFVAVLPSIAGQFESPERLNKRSFEDMLAFWGQHLRPDIMRTFNSMDPSSYANTNTYIYAGDLRNTLQNIREVLLGSWDNSEYPELGGYSDIATPVWSAYDLPNGYNPVYCLRTVNDQSSEHTSLPTSSDVMADVIDFVTRPSGTGVGAGSRPTAPTTPLPSYSSVCLDGSKPVPAATNAYRAGTSNGDSQSRQHVGGALTMVPGGGSVSIPVFVDGGGVASFFVTTAGEAVTTELVSPTGTHYAEISSGGVQFASLTAASGITMGGYTADAPETGEWSVEVSAPAGDSVAVSVLGTLDDAPIRMETSSDTRIVQPSQPLVFTASLSNQGAPLVGATVNASVLLPDTTFSVTVVMNDAGTGNDIVSGDGTYTGTFSQTATSGAYTAFIGASSQGVNAFTRVGRVNMDVVNGSAAPPQVLTEQVVDSDSDGLTDTLRVDVAATVTVGGTYMVRASMVDASGAPVTTASTVGTFVAGTNNVSLSFDGRTIRRRFGTGNLRLTDIRLAMLGDGTAVLPSALAADHTLSGSYSRTSFERNPIETTGDASIQVEDDDNDGLFERIVVTAPTVDLQYPDYYSFSLSLTDRLGRRVADASIVVGSIIQPGVYPGLEFTFDGGDIRSSGLDGPYFVRNLLVQGGALGTSLMLDRLGQTISYLHTQFGSPLFCESVASGAWSSPSTWSNCGGGAPGAGASAIVRSGHVVGIDADIQADSLRVEGEGRVELAEVPSLNVALSGALTVEQGGALRAVPPSSGRRTLTVGGDVVVDGELDLGSGSSSLSMVGEGGASVGGTDTLRVPIFRVDKESSTVELAGPVEVRERLDLASGTLDLQGQRLTLISDTTTGTIATLARNGGTLTGGDLTYQRRYLGDESWRLLSVPASGVPFSALNDPFHTQGAPWADFSFGGSNFYAFDPASQSYTVPQQDGPFEPGRGYFFYIYDGTAPPYVPVLPATWEVSGQENSSTFTVSVPFNNGDPDQSYSLLGNPFAAMLDWDQIGGTNGIGLTYDTVDSTGANVSYQAGGVDAGAGRYIAPFQAFWVQATAPGASVGFDRASVVAGGEPLVLGRQASSPLAVRFSVADRRSGRSAPGATLVLDSRAEAGRDALDASYFGPGTGVIPVAGVWFGSSDTPFAIEGRPQTGEQAADLHAVPTVAGTYELRWSGAEALPEGWSASLIDTVTGQQLDLRTTTTYEFTVDSGFAARTFPAAGPPTSPATPEPTGEPTAGAGQRLTSEAGEESLSTAGSYAAPARFRVVLSPARSALQALAAPAVAVEGQAATVAWRDALATGTQVRYVVQIAQADSSGAETVWSETGSADVREDGDYSVAVSGLDYGRYRVRVIRSERSGLVSASPEASLHVGVVGTHTLGRTRPNPVRGGASVSLAVAEAQRVVVEVYDLLGRRVMTAFDSEIEPDRTVDIQINGRMLSSGTYVVRVQGRMFTEAQKITVIR